jgi:hypothetical protein
LERDGGQEAKIVECPVLSDSMPEFETTYDIRAAR